MTPQDQEPCTNAAPDGAETLGWLSRPAFSERRIAPEALTDDEEEPDHPDAVQRLAAEIDAWQEMALAAKVEEGSADNLPPEELARLRALGYIR